MNEVRLIDANELEIELTKQKAHLDDKATHTTIESDRMMYINTATGLLHAINILHNAPTVEPSLNLDGITDEEIEKFKIIWQRANSKGLLAINEDKPQCDCNNCDFRKFTEKFIDGIVELMNENGIASLEQLSEMLGKGNDND